MVSSSKLSLRVTKTVVMAAQLVPPPLLDPVER